MLKLRANLLKAFMVETQLHIDFFNTSKIKVKEFMCSCFLIVYLQLVFYNKLFTSSFARILQLSSTLLF